MAPENDENELAQVIIEFPTFHIMSKELVAQLTIGTRLQERERQRVEGQKGGGWEGWEGWEETGG